jgi:hypothetical protein
MTYPGGLAGVRTPGNGQVRGLRTKRSVSAPG